MRRAAASARPPQPTHAADRGFVLLVAGLMTMSAATIDINLPAIPATAADLGAEVTGAQLTVSAFFLGFAAGQAAAGPLADRFGRRPVLLAGTGLYVLASLACALAGAIEALLALRVLQGAAAAVGPVLGRAIVRDRFEGAEMARVLSLAMAVFVLAPILAPSVGALILTVASWRWIFVALAAYGTVILLIVALRLEESLRVLDPEATRPARIARTWKAVLAERRSRPFVLIGVLCLAVLLVYLVNAPVLLMRGYGLDPQAFGLVFALVAVAAAAGSLVNARLARTLALERAIGLGLGLGLCATLANLGLLIGGRDTVATLLPGFALFFFSFGLVTANAAALALAPHGHIAGAASAVVGVLQTVLPGLVAGLVAVLSGGGAGGILVAMPLLLAAAALVLARRRRPVPVPAGLQGPRV